MKSVDTDKYRIFVKTFVPVIGKYLTQSRLKRIPFWCMFIGIAFTALWCGIPELDGYILESRSGLGVLYPALPLPNKLAFTGSYLIPTLRGRDQDISMVGRG